jgi:ABC-type polysaccharide/polyol phosphate export permease
MTSAGTRMSPLRSAWADLCQAWPTRRAWLTFALNDIKQRHRRSALGRIWILIATALTIGMIGLVFARVTGQPLELHLPYIAAGIVVWHFIASVLAESPLAFIGSEGLIKAVKAPRVMFVMRVAARNAMIFAANITIVVAVLAYYPPRNFTHVLFLIPGLALLIVNLLWIILLFGSLATRYRDVVPLSHSATQVLFLLTPIIYRQEQLGAQFDWVSSLNPLANLVAIVRDPMLGQAPPASAWVYCVALAIAGWGLAVAVFAWARPRIVLWL